MAWSLMLSLTGMPVILYGDEIGMGDNLDLDDRMSVRPTMQWSADANGGFSTADPADVVRPTANGDYGPQRVNVAAQGRDRDSLLSFMRRLIRRRRETPELGWGTSSLLETRAPSLFAHRCDWNESTVVTVHNLAKKPAEATLELGEDATGVEDLLEQRDHKLLKNGRLNVKLGSYGYLWLRVSRES
jgi:maltose alpha-D-glucosyltransferase/alpha-amylase